MTDSEFVAFCYRTILRRRPDIDAERHFSDLLQLGHLNRDEVLVRFLTSEEFEGRSGWGEFVPPGHFYSAVPSAEEREGFLSRDLRVESIPGIDLRKEQQLGLLKHFKKYYAECPFPAQKCEPFRYYFDNPAYSYTDALTLYSMMRHVQPKRIVEVGSGFSSAVMLDTIDHFLDGETQCTFIEPHPALLRSLLSKNDERHRIVSEKLQDVDSRVFAELCEHDILFIDSTHVSKLNSDVNRIFFEILPLLRKGVIIHFHDIFWPFEYLKDWIKEGKAWNEAYILRAFLEYNSHFEILFFSSFLHTFHREAFQRDMPLFLENTGGNIWIRKTKD